MAANVVKNGRFEFHITYRNFSGDEGLSIRVLGPVAKHAKELLRFDCFLKSPHYHTAVYDHNTITAIDTNNAAQWSLDKLEKEFVSLVSSAGSDPVNNEESAQLLRSMQEVRSISDSLIATEATQ